MLEFMASLVGLLLMAIAVAAGVIFPIWMISLAYSLLRSIRRIAESLERMEGQRLGQAVPMPLPTEDLPLQIATGHPVVNSMFGR